jgi:hypothetical protein
MESASQYYLDEDAADARLALEQAVATLETGEGSWPFPSVPVVEAAEAYYRFLRKRESLNAARLIVTAGPVVIQPAYAGVQ